MMGLIMEDFHFINILLNKGFHFTMKHKKIKDQKKKKGREGKEKKEEEIIIGDLKTKL